MKRRSFLIASSSIGAASWLADQRADAARADRSKPEVGDVLVHAFGTEQGRIIAPREVSAEPTMAFPRSGSGVVRSGSLHNQLMLVRVESDRMTSRMARYASGELLAYSASCTHTGCEVNGWLDEEALVVCPCHGSRFDLNDAAKVVLGPAMKPLAMLMIEADDEAIRITGRFSRRVGPEPLT